ncbi:hypothetical protein BJ912DRAFT_932899 [Pholiota molesta]|nr:hypothetical protein BJ912DRAFT_932899 [Pholiota molesta]
MPTSRTENINFTKGHAFSMKASLLFAELQTIDHRTRVPSDPFVTKKKVLLNVDMFTQPCWWTPSWGWMSFIPLAPSFTSTPSNHFAGCPALKKHAMGQGIDGTETRETRFKMADGYQKWKAREQQVDWFAIWMAYWALIAQASKLPMKNVPKPPAGFPVELPPWYWLLNTTMGYSPSWLDGLLSSSVVDPECARTGVIYRLSDRDRDRPLPIFSSIITSPSGSLDVCRRIRSQTQPESPSVRPSLILLQKALTLIFRTPNLSLPELIAKDAASVVRKYVTEHFRTSEQRAPVTKAQIDDLISTTIKERQYAAEVAISLPQQSYARRIDADEVGIERRQREVIESQQDVQRRRSREQKPPTKNTTMYEWIKHALPGGQDVFVRCALVRRTNLALLDVRKRDRIYNAMSNEWDFSEDDDENDRDGDDDDYFYNNDDYDDRITYHSPQWSRVPSAANWQELLKAVGFISNLPALAIDEDNQSSMWHFFSSHDANRRPSFDFYDLEEENRAALKFIVDFKEIQRPTQDLFIFQPLLRPHFTKLYDQQGLHTSIFRDLAHPFDVSDFEEAMLQCKSLLSSPRGRAAILMGGIVGRIAKEYISVDAVLHGPSIEITTHRVGYFGPSAGGDRRYCDDELTEHEIAVYAVHTQMYTVLSLVKRLSDHGFHLLLLGARMVLGFGGLNGQML